MRMRPVTEKETIWSSDEESGPVTSTSSSSLLRDKDEVARARAPLSTTSKCLMALALTALILLSFAPTGKPPKPAVLPPDAQTASAIFGKALGRALGGGIGGAIAGACQVLALMWLRTAMNYQYRHGGGLRDTLALLYAQGGVGRFYQGLGFALLQTPLSRFGDTATNVGVLAVFQFVAPGVPLGVRTAVASASGSLWRMLITPLDTFKTSLQVEGKEAYALIIRKARTDGIGTLWNGALGNAVASFVGSYPWFFTFNLLDEMLPPAPRGPITAYRLLRSAAMGCIATGVSDVVSNSVRVVKTTRQTSATQLSYGEAVQLVVAADGWRGLMCRGLGTRLLANALQSSLFAVIWKYVEAELNGTH